MQTTTSKIDIENERSEREEDGVFEQRGLARMLLDTVNMRR
jgi:hypothetical protein